MEPDSSASNALKERVRRIFLSVDETCTPLTASEVAERAECSEPLAREALEALSARDELKTKQIADQHRIWWARTQGSPPVEPESSELEAFVSAVEDYAIFMLDPDGVVVSWNEGAARIKGYREDEIVGKHFSTFYAESDADAGVPGRNLEIARQKGHVEDKGWRIRNDGTPFWAKVTITAVRTDDGTLRGFTKVTHDMTERREFEQRLREEHDFTEQVIETVPASVLVIESDGKIVRANARVFDRLSIDESELAEFDLAALDVYNEDGEPMSDEDLPWRRISSSDDRIHEFEYQVDLPEIGRRWLSLNAAPLDDERIVLAVDDITERKEHERTLERRKSELETQLSEILGRISDAFYSLDEEWRFTHLNDHALEIMQQSRDELLGQEVWDVLSDPEGTYEENFRRAMKTQESVNFEVFESRIETWLESTVYPSESGISIYFRDVTERKEREQTLDKYEAIVETVNDGIYVKDESGYFTMVNEGYAELTGYEKDELVGAHASLVVDEATIRRAKRKKAAQYDDAPLEATIERANGERVPAEAMFSTIDMEEGGTDQVGIVRDISDRKEYERKIKESERRYRTLVDNFPNGVVALFDGDLRYLTTGGELIDELGIDQQEAIGQAIYDRYPDELVTELTPYFEAALDGEESTFEVEYYDRNLLARTLPVESIDGRSIGMLVVQDITERRVYERQLEESNERLEQFAYAASHDLQEPLRMVSSYLQLIESRYENELDADGREFLEFAVDGANRMRNMIDGLLKYSRVDTRGDPFESVDVDCVLENARDDLQIRIEESDAEIESESLPRVEGDADQLRQVFQNLLENAIEYSGEEPPQIRVTAEKKRAEWWISVHDEGIGIDPGDTDRIFEVFQHLQTTADHSGTGIGLAICERIVERHGGDIWVESTPSGGSTFTFTLPPEK